MAQYLLRNTLNPSKVIACDISFRKLVNKGEKGESVWLIEVVTAEPHKDGTGAIPPVYAHYTTEQSLDLVIKEVTERVATQVDWAPLNNDIRPPFVVNYEPTGSTVSIYSDVLIDIEDVVPTTGIDIDSIEVIINDMDVTNEVIIDGNPFKYRVFWRPSIRVFEQE